MAIAIGPETPAPAPSPLDLGTALERAMARCFVAFQPIVSYRDRSVFGWEALLRTRAGRLAEASELLGAAESLGRLGALGRSVRAGAAAKAALAPPGTALFVNVHPRDLLDPDLFRAEAPLSRVARRVVLEVTERAAASGIPELQERLRQLRRLGFRLALDDVGAGHSNLSLLAEVRPEFLKVDMSLVRDLDRDRARRAVVRHLLRLSEDLGATAVAEGVETAGERDALEDLGGPLLQGFLFGRPSDRPAPPRW